jgi:hypothetical protein
MNVAVSVGKSRGRVARGSHLVSRWFAATEMLDRPCVIERTAFAGRRMSTYRTLVCETYLVLESIAPT